MKKTLTLRQLISLMFNVEGKITDSMVFYYLRVKHVNAHLVQNVEKPTASEIANLYLGVMLELLNLPITTAHQYPIYLHEQKDSTSKEKYFDICLLNPKAINPPKGKQPWGGKNFPKKTHYNVNDEKYSKYFAFGFSDWREIIDTPIINKIKGITNARVLSEILYELTFNGYTENECADFKKDLEKLLLEAKKDINKGKYITLPKTADGKYDIVFPDSIFKS